MERVRSDVYTALILIAESAGNISNLMIYLGNRGSYNARSLGARTHQAYVQTPDERRDNDALQTAHWVVSLLLGTHRGAVRTKFSPSTPVGQIEVFA